MDNSSYDLYIWASYGITALLFGGLCLVSLVHYLKMRRQIKKAEAA